jgi:hypothetical protein
MKVTTHRSALSVAPDRRSNRRRLRLAPVVLLVILTTAAYAAEAKSPRTAVLDFRSAIGGAPPDFGTTAARLVSEALAGTGKYDVLDYDVVRGEVAKRDLRPPFGVGHLQLLADVLKADLVVQGSVRSLTYDVGKPSASVVLSLEMVDGPSGDLKKRAEATGTFVAEAGTDQREVLVGALADAARQVVEAATGLTVRGETPKAVGAALQDRSGAAGPAEAGLAAALLPPVEVAAETPKTTAPAADLEPGGKPSPGEPEVSAIAAQAPKRGTRSDQGALPTKTETPGAAPAPNGTATTTTEHPPEEPPIEGSPDEELTPLIRVKVLAKLAADRVLVTLGKESALAPKMEMDVYRVTVSRDGTTTKRKLGRIRVVKINATDAEARILEGGPLMATGDFAYYYGP